MAFKKPVINQIKPDIKNANIYLRSDPKFGKSSLFRDVIIEKYGDPSYGLLIQCGLEKGATMLDNLNVVDVESYSDLVELKKWLIEEKGKEHHIEMICFDTVDQLIPIVESKAIADSFKENPTKAKPKSINSAFGGFGNGRVYASDSVLKPIIMALEKHFGVWGIAHCRWKSKKEKGASDDDAYQVFTSNLNGQYESVFGDCFDIIATGIKETEFIEKTEKRGGKEELVRYRGKVTRKLYFRGDGIIEAGGRFSDCSGVPEYMIFKKGVNNAKKFIEIIEQGMELSKLEHRKLKDYDDDEEEEVKLKIESVTTLTDDDDLIENEEKDSEINDDEDDIDNIFDDDEEDETVDKEALAKEVQTKFGKCKDKELKKKIRSMINGSASDTPLDVLLEIKKLLEG